MPAALPDTYHALCVKFSVGKLERCKLSARLVEELRKELIILKTDNLNRNYHAFEHNNNRIAEYHHKYTADHAGLIRHKQNYVVKNSMRKRKRSDTEKAYRV